MLKMERKSLKNVYYTIYIFLLIYFSRDTLVSTAILDVEFNSIILLLFGIPIFIEYIGLLKQRKIKKDALVVIAIFFVLIIGSMLIKLDFQPYTISILIFAFVGHMFSQVCEYEKFVRKYIYIMLFLSIFSLVTTYIIKPLIEIIGIQFFTFENSMNYSFYNFIFSFALTQNDYIRNFGIFREPGVYQFFINFSIIALIFTKAINDKKEKYILLIIFSITTISTFSTTGIILLPIIFAIYIFKLLEEKKLNIMVIKKIILVMIIVLLVLVVMYIFSNNFKETIDFSIKKIFFINESSIARLDSIIKPFQKFCESPFIGSKFQEAINVVEPNTNTSINIFSVYGLFVGLIHLNLLWLTVKKMNLQKITTICLFFVFIIGINTQILLGNAFLWTLQFSYYMPNNKED